LDTKPLANLVFYKYRCNVLDHDQIFYMDVYEKLAQLVKERKVFVTEAVLTEAYYFLRKKGRLSNDVIRDLLGEIIYDVLCAEKHAIYSEAFLRGFDYANSTIYVVSIKLFQENIPNVVITIDYGFQAFLRNNGLISYTIIDLKQFPEILNSL